MCRLNACPLGDANIDIADMRTTEGRSYYRFAAIDLRTKFAFVELDERTTRRVAGDTLRRVRSPS